MRLLVGAPEPLIRDVGVDLGGGQRGVAEKRLHAARVGPSLEEMSGHGVPQSVWSEVGGAVDDLQTAMNDPPDHSCIDSPAAVPNEHCGARLCRDEARPGWPEPCVQGPKRWT